MSSILILFAGPVLGIAVARLFGPVRPLSAFGAAILGQLLVFGTFAAWQYARAQRALISPSEQVVVFTLPGPPSLGRRILVIGALIMIASLVAVLFLGVQSLVTRPGHSSAAV
jgi:hypothetical protein